MLQQFFSDMLPDDKSFKLLWTSDDKKSYWFQDIDELIKFVENNNENIFFGLGTTLKKLSSKNRAKKQDIHSMRCLNLDIDLYSEKIKEKENLPKTIEEACKIAHGILEPTYLVFSGHGIHAYYLFWAHQEIDNFEFWELLSRAFQDAHREKFPQYEIDFTHDITRVMRCPGSINLKDPDNPIETKIIEYNENAVYSEEEVEDAIDFDPKKTKESVDTGKKESSYSLDSLKKFTNFSTSQARAFLKDNNLVLKKDAEIKNAIYLNLASLEPDFHDEFNNVTKRKSASEWDMKLANIAAKYNLSDQDILNLMIQHRTFNGHKLKFNNPAYYVNTMLKAKKHYAIKKIDKIPTKKLKKSDIEQIRQYLFTKLNIEIMQITRYDRSPNQYFEMILTSHPHKTIYMGNVQEGIVSQTTFRSKVIGATLEVPNQFKNATWQSDIVPKLMKLVVDGVASDTATYDGQVATWSKEYFFDKDILSDMNEFIKNNVPTAPFHHDGRVYFSFESLCHWIKTRKGFNVSTFHFGVGMTKAGFIQQTVNKTQLWATPPGYIELSKQDSAA